MAATGTVYRPYVAATLNGSPLSGVRKARVISSFNDPVTRIYVQVYPAVSWNEGDSITVTMGSGTNNVLSATGSVWEADYLMSGRAFELVGRGPLFAAQKYKMNNTGGMTLTELCGGPATDEVIARAVLDVAGISYTPANIGGTGITRGMLAPAAYTWRQGETALDYLGRLTRASLGYRMVETIGGAVQRVQVFGRPSATATYTLRQGTDIFDGGHAQFDAFSHYSYVTVTGYDYGDGEGAVTFTLPRTVPAGTEVYSYSSEMIERGDEAVPGGGISCATTAREFVLPEVDRIASRVSSIRTPRDDVFQPGQTHMINAEWLGLTNTNLWCMSVTRECDGKWFAQTMEYLGGGDITVQIPPEGRSTFEAARPVPARARSRDYTFIQDLFPAQIGTDAMVPGDQVTPQRLAPLRDRVFPRIPWNQRAHGGMLNSNTGNASLDAVFIP